MSKEKIKTKSYIEKSQNESMDFSYSRILNHEFEKSESNTRITKIPDEKKPTAKSLQQLQREINAQVQSFKKKTK